MDRIVELTKRHMTIMKDKNILVSVYTNASGFLWSMMMVDSGTDLGWSDENGNHKYTFAFIEYEDRTSHIGFHSPYCSDANWRARLFADDIYVRTFLQ